MTSTINLIQISRKKLLEEGQEILSDNILLTYANFCYEDLIKRTFTNKMIVTGQVTLINGVGTLPLNFGTLYQVYDDQNNIFEEVTIADFITSISERIVSVEGNTLNVKPKTVTSLNIKYYKKYDELSFTQNPEIESYFHELIIYGILQRAYEDLQNENLSKYYEAKFEQEYKKRSDTMSNYEEEHQKGGQMFNYQPLI